MSFLIRSLLGENVVHPQEHPREKTDHTNDNEAATQKASSPISSPLREHREMPLLEKQKAPTRTIILRVQSCTVAQDRRDALRDMQSCVDLPYVMASKEVSYLCNMLRTFPEDEEIVEPSLAILASVTDLSSYPTGSTSYSVTDKEKRRIRDSFLHELVAEVPLFLIHLKEGLFWSRFHSVQMLQRLQEYDSLSVQKLFLSSHGIGVLVDILNDNTHGGALRNEGLVLITSITATDTELQTLLAFDNAFETLFAVIREEGGLEGGVIVSDCLTIVHNMLRNNKATQKLFREMGCARYLGVLMDAVPARVRHHMGSSSPIKSKKNNNHSTNSDSTKSLDNETSALAPLTNIQGVVIVMAVSIASCILREAEAHHEAAAAQDALLQSGLLAPLTSLALGGALANDAARVEAMRTLATLLHEKRMGIEKFLQLNVITLRGWTPLRVEEWSALRATLHVLFDVEDHAIQSAAAKVLHTLLGVSVCESIVLAALTKGFAPPSMLQASLLTPDISLPRETGACIATALFGHGTAAHSRGQYYAALLLDRFVSVSNTADQLLGPPQGNYFTTYLQYVIRCFSGHGVMDLNTLSACFKALLRWIRSSRQAIVLFLNDLTYYKALLQRAIQDDGPAHIRFWSAVLCAALCILAPRDPVHSPLLDRRHALELFINELGGAAIFDTLLFDVKASSPVWSNPPSNAFLRQTPVMYDEEMKNMLLDVVKEFKEICPSRRATIAKADHEMENAAKHLSKPSIGLHPEVCPVTDRAETMMQLNFHDRPLSGNASAVFYPSLDQIPSTPSISGGINVPDDCSSFSHREEGMPSMSPVMKSPRRIANLHPPPPLSAAAAAAAAASSDHGLSPLIDEYETQLIALRERNMILEQELQLSRDMARQDASNRLAEAEREQQHAAQVAELQENIRLLEEALAARDEEHVSLVQSLNMLEAQLRAALANRETDTGHHPTNTTATARTLTDATKLRGEVQKMTEERDALLLLVAELDEERTPCKMDCLNSLEAFPHDSPSFSLSPPPSHAPSADPRHAALSNSGTPSAFASQQSQPQQATSMPTPHHSHHHQLQASPFVAGHLGNLRDSSPQPCHPGQMNGVPLDVLPRTMPIPTTTSIATGTLDGAASASTHPFAGTTAVEEDELVVGGGSTLPFGVTPQDQFLQTPIETRLQEARPPPQQQHSSRVLNSNPFMSMGGPSNGEEDDGDLL